jgi:hypothetical protein
MAHWLPQAFASLFTGGGSISRLVTTQSSSVRLPGYQRV